jgi:MoxR-like ATPase
MNEHTNDVAAIDRLAADYNRLKAEIGKVIVGQEEVVKLVLMSIFSDGHSLLVGVPGLAKTLLIKTISSAYSSLPTSCPATSPVPKFWMNTATSNS